MARQILREYAIIISRDDVPKAERNIKSFGQTSDQVARRTSRALSQSAKSSASSLGDLTSSTRGASRAGIELARIANDLQVGAFTGLTGIVQATSNNIEGFVSAVKAARSEAGSFGRTLRNIFFGGNGLLVALSLATTAFVVFGDKIRDAFVKGKTAAEEFAEAQREALGSVLNIELPTQTVTIETRLDAENAKQALEEFLAFAEQAETDALINFQGLNPNDPGFAAADEALRQIRANIDLYRGALEQTNAAIRAFDSERSVASVLRGAGLGAREAEEGVTALGNAAEDADPKLALLAASAAEAAKEAKAALVALNEFGEVAVERIELADDEQVRILEDLVDAIGEAQRKTNEYQDALKQVNPDVIAEVTAETENAVEETDRLGEALSAVVSVADGLGRLADAFDIGGEAGEAVDAVRGLVQAYQDLRSAADAAGDAGSLIGALGTAGGLGAAFAGITSVISLLDSVFSGGSDFSEVTRDLIESTRDQVRSLESLTTAVRENTRSLQSDRGTDISALIGALQATQGAAEQSADGTAEERIAPLIDLLDLLRSEQIESFEGGQIAELIDEFFGSLPALLPFANDGFFEALIDALLTGNTDALFDDLPPEFERLFESLLGGIGPLLPLLGDLEDNLGSFGQTVQGALDRFRTLSGLQGLLGEDALTLLQEVFKDLGGDAGQLLSNLIGDLPDISTDEGQAALDALIADLIAQFGDFAGSAFADAGFTASELESVIRALQGLSGDAGAIEEPAATLAEALTRAGLAFDAVGGDLTRARDALVRQLQDFAGMGGVTQDLLDTLSGLDLNTAAGQDALADIIAGLEQDFLAALDTGTIDTETQSLIALLRELQQGFADTVDAVRTLPDALGRFGQLRQAGVDDATALAILQDELQALAPSVADALSGLDLTGQAGQDRLLDLLDRLRSDLASGGPNLDGLTDSELASLIGSLSGLQATDTFRGGVQQVQSLTQFQGNEILGALSTGLDLDRVRNSVLAEIARAVSGASTGGVPTQPGTFNGIGGGGARIEFVTNLNGREVAREIAPDVATELRRPGTFTTTRRGA